MKVSCPLFHHYSESTTHALWSCHALKTMRKDFGVLFDWRGFDGMEFKDFFSSAMLE